MKLTSVLLATTLVLPTAALAGDAGVAVGLATVGMYDANCGKLPARMIDMAKAVLATIPRVTMIGAISEVKTEYASNPSKWCAENKARIDAADAATR